MGYKNARGVLPDELLREVQKYIQGELIYIPKCGEKRMGWGVMNGAKYAIEGRNREICCLYKGGLTVECLIQRYHLSEDSIRKIITKTGDKL